MLLIDIIAIILALYSIYVAKKASKQSSADALLIRQATKELTKAQLTTELVKIETHRRTVEESALHCLHTVNQLKETVSYHKNDPLRSQDYVRHIYEKDELNLQIFKDKLDKLTDELNELREQESSLKKQLEEL